MSSELADRSSAPPRSEQTAELRGEALVWQMLVHQATAQLTNLARHPHNPLRGRALDVVAEAPAAPEKLLPVTLVAELRCEHHVVDCCCVRDLIDRGSCLHCDWEGPVCDARNTAVEDAHNHAWPGGRELPIVPRRSEPSTTARQKAATVRPTEEVNAAYPTGWLVESGGPIRTARSHYGTRHVPDYTRFGGDDPRDAIEPEPG